MFLAPLLDVAGGNHHVGSFVFTLIIQGGGVVGRACGLYFFGNSLPQKFSHFLIFAAGTFPPKPPFLFLNDLLYKRGLVWDQTRHNLVAKLLPPLCIVVA